MKIGEVADIVGVARAEFTVTSTDAEVVVTGLASLLSVTAAQYQVLAVGESEVNVAGDAVTPD